MDMDQIFDTHTLFSIYFVAQVILAVLFVFAISVYKKPFLKLIAFGLLIEATSALILIIAGTLSLPPLLFVANMFGIIGPMLITEGILKMLGKNIPKLFKQLYYGIGSISFIVTVFIIPHTDYRIVTFFLWTIISVVATLILIPYKIKRQRPYIYFLAFIHLIYIYPLAYRIYNALSITGTTDFFPQSLHLHLQLFYLIIFVILRGTIILLITAGQLQDKLEEANKKLTYLSLTDDLTQVNNKRSVLKNNLLEAVDKALYLAKNSGKDQIQIYKM